MPTVTFEDLSRSVRGQAGASLLEVCDAHGLPMETACGGFAACNSCRVRVIAGELSPLDPSEDPFLDRPDQRLGCQARLLESDVVLALEPG
jgi:adenylate cyclase